MSMYTKMIADICLYWLWLQTQFPYSIILSRRTTGSNFPASLLPVLWCIAAGCSSVTNRLSYFVALSPTKYFKHKNAKTTFDKQRLAWTITTFYNGLVLAVNLNDTADILSIKNNKRSTFTPFLSTCKSSAEPATLRKFSNIGNKSASIFLVNCVWNIVYTCSCQGIYKM